MEKSQTQTQNENEIKKQADYLPLVPEKQKEQNEQNNQVENKNQVETAQNSQKQNNQQSVSFQNNSFEYNQQAASVQAYAYVEDCNIRSRGSMEDGHLIIDQFMEKDQGLFCIFDGHGGKKVMQFCIENFANEMEKQIRAFPEDINTALDTTYKEIDKQLEQMKAEEYGSTCTSVLIRKEKGQKIIYSANVGDSRAVLIKSQGVKRISYDHKGSDSAEQQRIKESGGFMIGNRTGGTLAITRALGDFAIKSEGLICDPYIERIEVTEQEKFIVIASDGLWDVVKDEDLPDSIQNDYTSEDIAKSLLKLAQIRESTDNLSIIVIQL